ncbi:MAG TPA: hypothetical protein VL025_07675 [Thermoanaerobaculia bacterium]|nr:hypothetical protein [Thermoanaerobaculia bacterium]
MLSLRKLKTAALLLAALTPAAWAQQPAEPPEARTVLLAKFHLANGNTVQMWSLPDVDEIMIGEITKAGPNERFFLKPETHPVEVFRLLAPKNSPVPRAIAQIDHDKVLEGRKLVNTLSRTIEVPVSRLGLQAVFAPKAVGAGSCEPGNGDGADYFEDHHCYTLGGPGYGTSEGYCFKDSADWIQKTSDDQRRATYTRMAACGSAMSRLRHFYDTVSGWTTQVNVYVDAQQVISWWSYKDGIKRYRRVRFEEKDEGSGAWVRGWVKYHSEAADGW